MRPLIRVFFGGAKSFDLKQCQLIVSSPFQGVLGAIFGVGSTNKRLNKPNEKQVNISTIQLYNASSFTQGPL